MRLFLLLGLLTVVPAWAQSPGVSGSLEQASATTPEEKQAFASGAVTEIDEAVKAVEKLKEQAEKDKQTEVVECLVKKLTPLRALGEIARGSKQSLDGYLAARDNAHADLEYRKIAVAVAKARELLAEAQACAWESGVRRGEAVVSIEDEEPDDVPLVDIPDVQPPVFTPN